MSPGSNTESYPAFAHIGLRENPGKNLNQVKLLYEIKRSSSSSSSGSGSSGSGGGSSGSSSSSQLYKKLFH
ncbi:hypothetical protein ANN_00637 [Periplaneta americana]|uniref:Uncharacterized protein n=1 Tax=Periplaneta americana TaxID=6978 RepID=A0ABQ8TU93_PERAM|nr:hypothetical protein ANN_00637 [Periplaneta americana]